MPNQKNNTFDRVEELIDKRQKQLDELIGERQQLTEENTELKTQQEVLIEQIKVKRQMLKKANSVYEEAKQKIEEQLVDLRKSTDDANQENIQKLTELDASHQQIKDAKWELDELNGILYDLKSQIKETRKYLTQQEAIVNETIDSWNNELIDLKAEIEQFQANKRKGLEERTRAEQDIITLSEQIDLLNSKIEHLDDTYQSQLNNKKSELEVLDSQISQRKTEIDQFDSELTAKRKLWATKEKQMQLEAFSLQEKTKDLRDKEKRLRLNFRSSNLEWDDDIILS